MPENPDQTPADDATDEVLSAVLTASRVLVAVSVRSLAEVEDRLTVTQFRALVVLSGDEDTNLNRLAEALGVSPSTALRTLDRLVAAGLAARRANHDNRREVVLSVTEEGNRVVRDVTASRRRDIGDILGRMPSQRRAELVSAFRAFAVAAHEPLTASPGSSTQGW